MRFRVQITTIQLLSLLNLLNNSPDVPLSSVLSGSHSYDSGVNGAGYTVVELIVDLGDHEVSIMLDGLDVVL